MQIHLTYRNSLRNVKRRVLHKRASAMCYITRDHRADLSHTATPAAKHSVSSANNAASASTAGPISEKKKERLGGKTFFCTFAFGNRTAESNPRGDTSNYSFIMDDYHAENTNE